MSLDFESMTWICHVCGEERPDAQISVYTSEIVYKSETDFSVKQNVRYCNDRPACVAAAPSVQFIK